MTIDSFPSVDILLPAYDATSYIACQVDSILAQDYPNFRLICYDDFSSDNTGTYLKSLAESDSRVKLVFSQLPFRDPRKSFEFLLSISTAEYVLFSDHDDYWLPFKISHLVQTILSIPGSGPKLVSSNSYLWYDTDLPTIPYSELKLFIPHDQLVWFNALSHEQKSLYLSTSNLITGHNCILNRELIDLSLPFDHNVRMHDWWIAILASLCGNIYISSKCLTLYRQHKNNYVGNTSLFLKLSSATRYCSSIKQSHIQFSKAYNRARQCGYHLKNEQFPVSITENIHCIRGLRLLRLYRYAGLLNLRFGIEKVLMRIAAAFLRS